MVNKERLGGFVDAVVAVVMTIMLLEFHTPKDGSIVDFFTENAVYLVAYLLSFVYVVTSWYNQQYMLSLSERVTKRIYFATVLWMLALSLLPVLSAWTGQTITIFENYGINSPKLPALLFALMIYFWGFAYVFMTKAYIKDNPREKSEIIGQMDVYQYLGSPFWFVGMVITLGLTFYYPPFVFIYTGIEMGLAVYRSRNVVFAKQAKPISRRKRVVHTNHPKRKAHH